MHYREGRYYLSYSHGGWQTSSYSVHYATADTPIGPWTYRGAILTSDGKRKGPGHHSFIRSPLTGEWLIAYHRWENQTGDGPYRGSRQICIDRVEYTEPGLIRPILMTTLCTLFGLLPLALGIGSGAELQKPLAIAVIGGLALSTLITLVIIPVLYSSARRLGRHTA